MEMTVVKERKFEEERKFLIEPLNIAAVNRMDSDLERGQKKKLRVGVYVCEILFLV